MRTILHLIDTTGPGGAETVFFELIKATMEKGYKAIVVIRGPGWVEDQLKCIGCEYYIIDCKGSFNYRFLIELMRLIKHNQVALVQTHLFGSAIYGALASWLTRTYCVCTLHGMVDIGENERFLWLKRKAIALGATKIVTVTDQLFQKVEGLKLVPSQRIKTIYNGIDTELFVHKGKDAFRSKLGISDDALVIGSLGNIRTPKNYPLAIDALVELHKSGNKAHYLIAGQGSEKQKAPLVKKIEENGLDDFVHLLGFVSDTPEFLSSLDLFLMSSSSEGHPLAMTQAMSVGVPVVSTPSGVQEIASNGEEIVVSKDHCASLLFEDMLALIRNEALVSKLTEKAKMKVQEKYSVSAMLQSYFSIYNSCF